MRTIVSIAFACSISLALPLHSSVLENIKEFFSTNPVLYYYPENLYEISCKPPHNTTPFILFRSAQLPSSKLEEVVTQHKIATIINLRFTMLPFSSNTPQWFVAEQELAKRLGTELITIPLNPARFPTKNELVELLDTFSRYHGPLLIHCKAGADRSGLVAALFVLEMQYGYEGAIITDPQACAKALEQLSFRFGHYTVLYPAMKHFIRVWYDLRTQYTRKDALMHYDPATYKQSWNISDIFRYLRTAH